MSPITHLLASWMVAAHATENTRDCRLVALAGIAPDLDGLGVIWDVAGPRVGFSETETFGRFPHPPLHGLLGAVIISLLLACPARRRWRVALLATVNVHLHLLFDLVGSRGPTVDGIWPIAYLEPFSHLWVW